MQKTIDDWNEAVQKQDRYTTPWLELNRDDLEKYSNGQLASLPRPYAYCYPHHVFKDIVGKKVLCLASGGGQQSALYGLLGAKVTVLDICEGQLKGDKAVAAHYGYQVKTILGDMRDLTVFEDESFDLVYQAISLAFVPNICIVYKEVARILKPGGLYRSGHVNPATVAVSFEGPDNGWDGVGYRIAEPYASGPILQQDNGNENMHTGSKSGEYVHSLSDIFNSLVASGFYIKGVWEDPEGDLTAEKGSEAHMRAFIQQYFAIVAEKPEA